MVRCLTQQHGIKEECRESILPYDDTTEFKQEADLRPITVAAAAGSASKGFARGGEQSKQFVCLSRLLSASDNVLLRSSLSEMSGRGGATDGRRMLSRM